MSNRQIYIGDAEDMLYTRKVSMTDGITVELTHENEANVRSDMLTRVISSIVPAVLFECAKHSMNVLTSEQLVDIEADIMRSLAFDPATADLYNEQQMGGFPTPMQVMKVKLYDVWREARASIIDDVRLAIKEELRMEMYLELQQMREDIAGKSNNTTSNTTSGTTSLRFNADDGRFDRGIGVISALDRVSQRRDAVPGTINTTDLYDNNLTGTNQDDSYITKLVSNPLYKTVCDRLTNMHNSKGPVLSTEEYMKGRRFDSETLSQLEWAQRQVEEFEISQAKSEQVNDDNTDDEDEARWNDLVTRTKYNNH